MKLKWVKHKVKEAGVECRFLTLGLTWSLEALSIGGESVCKIRCHNGFQDIIIFEKTCRTIEEAKQICQDWMDTEYGVIKRINLT